MTQDQRTKMVTKIMLSAVKARSVAAEMETLEVAKMLDPKVYGDDDLSILTVSHRMLEGRSPTQIDLYNLLAICDMSDTFHYIYQGRWNEELPEPHEVLGGINE